MEPQIQFTRTSDGIRIAYMQLGAGKPILYSRMAGIGMQHQLEIGETRLVMLAAAAAVTTFDRGGLGASQRNVSDVSTDAQVRELEAVAACVAAETFVLVAGGSDAAAAAAYAAGHPERVELLVCLNPAPSDPREWPLEFLRDNWSMSRRYIANNQYPNGPVELQRRFSRAMADSVDHKTYVRYAEASRTIDYARLYAGVRVPALVIQRVKDAAARDRLQPIIDALPDCNLILLDGGRGPEAAREELGHVFRFAGIELPAEGRQAAPEMAVILFADIVDSTAVTDRIGNAGFRERAAALEARVRAIVSAHAGTAVAGRTLGDGVLATFPSAAQAIAAAVACAAAGVDLGLGLHLGLHAGDVFREDGNVHGIAVSLASRVSALTAPDEILVSQTVRDLARASTGVTFEDRGEHALKGIADPVRVFAVRPGQ